MRIGYDVSQTGKSKAGCGYMAYSLANALAGIDSQNDYLLYPTFGDLYFDPNWAEDTLQINRPNFRRGFAQRGLDEAFSFWNDPPDNFEEQLGNPDIIHGNNFYCPAGLKRARLVYTLHDMSFISNPEWMTEANRVICFDGAFKASLFADFIIAVSEFSREYFLKTFPFYPPERTTVVPLASRYAFKTAPPRPDKLSSIQSGEFWLNVGTIEPRKNQVRMLHAYADYISRHEDAHPLILAGGKGWLIENINEFIQDLGLEQHVQWLGYVDEATLQWLYSNCYAFLYPSLLEGFGLPVLEAMSQGAAVITSNITSLPEVIGDSGLQVDPYHEDEISNAMEQLSNNEILRQQFKSKAAERANLFTWEKSARLTLEVYQTVMEMDKR